MATLSPGYHSNIHEKHAWAVKPKFAAMHPRAWRHRKVSGSRFAVGQWFYVALCSIWCLLTLNLMANIIAAIVAG